MCTPAASRDPTVYGALFAGESHMVSLFIKHTHSPC